MKNYLTVCKIELLTILKRTYKNIIKRIGTKGVELHTYSAIKNKDLHKYKRIQRHFLFRIFLSYLKMAITYCSTDGDDGIVRVPF